MAGEELHALHVKIPAETYDQLRELAFWRKTTMKQVLLEALSDFDMLQKIDRARKEQGEQ